ncbi:sensor histidine kinase [Cryptosporangium arvum]|uniref:Sensor-like histidine kinase SenX3 n=1 Tax=Cryptosporangium arvum DSM 44712 TaxID=927661 RepID=A0A010ZR37_9ACTN|nr:ATP-binding protein [Cryptosporangium arvum]EXG79672.1 bacteriophytochrome (light-regulated signal transduction histidine kinase) [Cryptosporangium arvum DSM 44712]
MSTLRSRAQMLEPYAIIGEPPEPDLEAIASIAAHICGAPTAVVNLIDDTHQHQVAAHGFARSVCDREDSMCAVSIALPEPVYLPDARLDPRWADNPFVTGVIGDVRFYSSTQLINARGEVLGTLCVFDEEVREITADQRTQLELLAHQVVDVLELRRQSFELHAAIAQLEHAREELERSNEHLAAFAGQVSHDLKNPLASVVGYLHNLSEVGAVVSEPEAAWCTQRALAASQRMSDMIGHLLDYASVGGSLTLVPVDLGQVVADLTDDLSDAIASVGGALAVEGQLPTVAGDSVQLRAVLQNLISNALKFRRLSRPPRVVVSAAGRDGTWLVRVADNGIGIPSDRREQAFALLSRVHDESAREIAGNGIGLATCKRIVTAHGGEIGLTDTPGGGTTVWFTLPVDER